MGPAQAAADIQQVTSPHHQLDEQLKSRRFLVGDTFTRTDLTPAALLGVALRVKGYGAELPPAGEWPQGLLEVLKPIEETLTAQRVREHYAAFRN